jgi:decaprenyl-phosphate phosphoribosyltransferase
MSDSQTVPPAQTGPTSGPTGSPAKTGPLWLGLLKTARPKQWVKNVLLFAAPMAAGQLFAGAVLSNTLLGFAAFVLASVSTYFVNDALDYESDRRHPTKCRRPIAAGQVGLGAAWLTAAVTFAGAMAIAFALVNSAFGGLLIGYVAMTLSYSLYLKRVAVVELACVAAGFVLRMIGGGLATGVPISDWFLTVACFSSLFIVAGKRYAEIVEMGEGNQTSRRVLQDYTTNFLRTAYSVALAVSLAAYCQWAFDQADNVAGIWYQLSAVPWVAALLRYSLLLERGQGGAPEEIIMRDRVLQLLGVIWIVIFLLGVYDH